MVIGGFSMERIAIISDIHGNITALEAVLEDISKKGIKRIFCLGDIIGKGPFPETAVDIVRSKCERVVRGNWDTFIVNNGSYDVEVGEWNINKLGPDRIEYLKQLPLYIEFFMSGRLIRLFHATSDDVFKRILGVEPVEVKLCMFDKPKDDLATDRYSDVVGYGDIHNAYVQNFRDKTIFNVGSVGNPLDIRQSAYAIIEGIWDKREQDSFSVTLVRVPYDIEKAVKEAEDEIGMPERDEYITELRTGKYRGSSKKKENNS
jgi:predicted phosphodiesterase